MFIYSLITKIISFYSGVFTFYWILFLKYLNSILNEYWVKPVVKYQRFWLWNLNFKFFLNFVFLIRFPLVILYCSCLFNIWKIIWWFIFTVFAWNSFNKLNTRNFSPPSEYLFQEFLIQPLNKSLMNLFFIIIEIGNWLSEVQSLPAIWIAF